MRRAFLLIFFSVSAVSAIELYSTTADIVKNSPYVSHVIVEEGALRGGILEYDLLVIRDFKKSLPERIKVRLPILPTMGVDRHVDPPGSQWIVMLGEKSGEFYPFRSLTWGRIPLFKDDSGELRLSRHVTGLGGGQFQGKSMTLSEFSAALAARRPN